MDKVLVTIYVLSLEEEFDLYLPINILLSKVIDEFQNELVNSTNNEFVKIENPILYNNVDGTILNNNNLVKECGISSGCKILLR